MSKLVMLPAFLVMTYLSAWLADLDMSNPFVILGCMAVAAILLWLADKLDDTR